MLTRKCNCCKTEKTLDAFYKIKNGTDGVRPTCKDCAKEKERKKYGDDAQFRWSKLSNQARKLRDDPEHLAKHRYRMRRWHLQNTYGLSMDDFDRMYAEQDGKCEICGSKQIEGKQWSRIVVDHDHKTNSVRGLLCDLCNTALGKFKDSPELLSNAIVYLRKYGKS